MKHRSFFLSVWLLLGVVQWLSGCASTASSEVKQEALQLYTLGPKYAMLSPDARYQEVMSSIQMNQVDVLFHIADGRIFVDSKQETATQTSFDNHRQKGETYDCLRLNWKDKDGKQAPKWFTQCGLNYGKASSVFTKRTFSASGTFVGIALYPITLLSLATNPSHTGDLFAPRSVDQETLDRFGEYLINSLLADIGARTDGIRTARKKEDLTPNGVIDILRDYPGSTDVQAELVPSLRFFIQKRDLSAFRSVVEKLGTPRLSSLLPAILELTIEQQEMDYARIVWAAGRNQDPMKAPGLESKYKSLAFKRGTFADIAEFGADAEAVKRMMRTASTESERKTAERNFVNMFRDKLFDIKVGVRSGGSVVTRKSGELMSIIAPYVNSTGNGEAVIELAVDSAIFKPKHLYQLTAKFVPVSVGVKLYKYNCGFLWMATCDGRDDNATAEGTPFTVTATVGPNNTKIKTTSSFEWISVKSGRSLFWNPSLFKANDFRIDLKSLEAKQL